MKIKMKDNFGSFQRGKAYNEEFITFIQMRDADGVEWTLYKDQFEFQHEDHPTEIQKQGLKDILGQDVRLIEFK